MSIGTDAPGEFYRKSRSIKMLVSAREVAGWLYDNFTHSQLVELFLYLLERNEHLSEVFMRELEKRKK